MSFWGRTYINQPSSCQFEFEFLGPHLYRSVIFRVSLSIRGCTYIDRSFLTSVQFEFLGSHVYQLVICHVIFVLVWAFGTAPISISHSSSCQFCLSFGTAPISIGHSSCRFEFLFFETALISISQYLISWVESVRPWATLYPPFKFTAHISVMLLGIPRLAFSCGSHRAVSFEHILFYTPRWFDRYSSLTSTYKSLLEGNLLWAHSFLYSKVVWPLLIFNIDLQVTFGDILEGAWVLSIALEALWDIRFSLSILESLYSSVGLSEFVFY